MAKTEGATHRLFVLYAAGGSSALSTHHEQLSVFSRHLQPHHLSSHQVIYLRLSQLERTSSAVKR